MNPASIMDISADIKYAGLQDIQIYQVSYALLKN